MNSKSSGSEETDNSSQVGKISPIGDEFKIVPCGIYTRVSTDEQARPEHYSLESQESYGLTEIKNRQKEGWVHRITFVDDGYSGADFDRPGLLRLISMVKRGEIAVIVAYVRDRLWRSGSISAQVQLILDQHDVRILTTEGIHDRSPHSQFLAQVLDANAQFARAHTRMQVNDNMRFAAKKGDWKGGSPSYGYSYIRGEKTLRLNESEAPTVKMIFERIADGVSTCDLVRELRRMKIYGRPRKPRRAGR